MSDDDELGEGEVVVVVGGSIQSGWGGNGGAVQYRGMVLGGCSLTRSCPVTFEM